MFPSIPIAPISIIFALWLSFPCSSFLIHRQHPNRDGGGRWQFCPVPTVFLKLGCTPTPVVGWQLPRRPNWQKPGLWRFGVLRVEALDLQEISGPARRVRYLSSQSTLVRKINDWYRVGGRDQRANSPSACPVRGRTQVEI